MMLKILAEEIIVACQFCVMQLITLFPNASGCEKVELYWFTESYQLNSSGKFVCMCTLLHTSKITR